MRLVLPSIIHGRSLRGRIAQGAEPGPKRCALAEAMGARRKSTRGGDEPRESDGDDEVGISPVNEVFTISLVPLLQSIGSGGRAMTKAFTSVVAILIGVMW